MSATNNGNYKTTVGRQGGKNLFMLCTFDLAWKATNIRLEFGDLTFQINNADNFDEWIYLLMPTQYEADTKRKDQSFVISADFNATNHILTLQVNHVMASCAGGGLQTEQKTYQLQFK
jgi:hypothetical protein